MPAIALLVAPAAQVEQPRRLLPPVKIHVAGKPIDVQRSGHAAPFVGDFDGDGKLDLLVGQFHDGRLRVYRNVDDAVVGEAAGQHGNLQAAASVEAREDGAGGGQTDVQLKR